MIFKRVNFTFKLQGRSKNDLSKIPTQMYLLKKVYSDTYKK